jgi:anti-sigma factor RsiW
VVERPTVVLTCFRARRRIGAYLDGALAGADARRTERHLASCASCQREAGQLRRVKALVAEAAAIPEPDWTGFWPGIVRGIDAQRHGVASARPRPTWRLWPGWAIGSAMAAALALAVVSWQGTRGPLPAEAGVLVSAADTEHPTASVMVYTPPDRDMAVVWLFDSD